ncbi:MAG TPA: hypothetical protein PK476_02085 [Candidatus Pacearchaeota archaeon]|nr:hypothetical protein [Candidatus Pacearchaeota archaeon]HQM24681.1 hypothetical protein [Candidatus Pacearchaeota archaeon]
MKEINKSEEFLERQALLTRTKIFMPRNILPHRQFKCEARENSLALMDRAENFMANRKG